ncbi:MAG: hypothetical protein J6C40_12115, partial [Lentisphaeria bacterium]|nr:hypothetical protein [Lentisphaeria bacterium]
MLNYITGAEVPLPYSRHKKGAVAKPQKKESNSLFLLFERKVGGIISHDRRKSWLILQVLRVICS